MMRVVVVLALLAQPAAAECFVGQPHKVTYSNGQVMQVLDRKGEVVTYQWHNADGDGAVQTSHLMLFPLASRTGDKTRHDRWQGRLPRLADLVPGYQFDVAGVTEFLSGGKAPVRLKGEVVAGATVAVGPCAYATTVIKSNYFVGQDWMSNTTTYLRTDMLVVLQSESYLLGADPTSRVATVVE